MVFKTLKKAVSKIVGDKQEDSANSIAASKMLSLAQKSGYLQKSGGSVKSWKTRLFILVDKNLMYYKDEKVAKKIIIFFFQASEPLGYITLDEEKNIERTDKETGRENSFKVVSMDRIFYMAAESDYIGMK